MTGEGCLGNEYGLLFGDGIVQKPIGRPGVTNTIEKESQGLVTSFIVRLVLKMSVPVVGKDAGHNIVYVFSCISISEHRFDKGW